MISALLVQVEVIHSARVAPLVTIFSLLLMKIHVQIPVLLDITRMAAQVFALRVQSSVRHVQEDEMMNAKAVPLVLMKVLYRHAHHVHLAARPALESRVMNVRPAHQVISSNFRPKQSDAQIPVLLVTMGTKTLILAIYAQMSARNVLEGVAQCAKAVEMDIIWMEQHVCPARLVAPPAQEETSINVQPVRLITSFSLLLQTPYAQRPALLETTETRTRILAMYAQMNARNALEGVAHNV